MELLRWEPFGDFGKLHSALNDLFAGDFNRSPAQRSLSNWHPAVDVLESKDAYLIRGELPGMKREDIHVEVKEGTLVVSGERKSEKPAEGVEYRHVERVAAKFRRAFSLPDTAKPDEIDASYKDGIIEIRVPKAEKAKPRQIDINVH